MAELVVLALILALAIAGAIVGVDSRPGVAQVPRPNI